MNLEAFARMFAALSVVAALAGNAPAASVPHTFTAGTVASAAEVNANFAALVEAINALEAKVDPQDAAALAGTYDYFELRIDVDNINASAKSIAGQGTSGTVVLNSDGSGHANLSGQYRQIGFSEVNGADQDATVEVNFGSTPESVDEDISWSYTNGVVTVADSGESFAVVGRLLIRGMVNDEGQSGIIILTRR
jgi:hypothetical protein